MISACRVGDPKAFAQWAHHQGILARIRPQPERVGNA